MPDKYVDLSHYAADIDRAIDQIVSHVNDNTSHVTSAERESWNAKATSSDISAEAEARQAADAALQSAAAAMQNDLDKNAAALSGQIDGGAKNRLTINSGSSTPPTRWIDIPVNIEPGTYHVYFGDLASDDTDAETCQMIFFDSSMQQASGWLMLPRGNDVSGVITVTAAAATFRLYPSNSYANSTGDTVTFTNAMICAEAEWAMSQKYVPYCPTLPELYAMIQALQS